jgi:hypothetical protein
MRVTPAHTLAHQDATDLAAFDDDPSFFGHPRQGIQTPLGLSLFLAGHHRSISLCVQPPWWCLAHQRDQAAVVLGRQAARPSWFGPIAQTLDALGVKAVQATTHRLGTALQVLGHIFHPLSIPTACHHARMQNPVGWPMPAPCQFAYLFLFLLIVCCSHS